MALKIFKEDYIDESATGFPEINRYSEFKKNFKDILQKGGNPNFEDIKVKTISTQNNFFEEENYNEKWNKEKEWFENIVHFNFIKNFIEDIKINEVIIHSNNFIQTEEHGSLENHISNFLDQDDLQTCFDTLTTRTHINWNFSNPFASFFVEIHNTLFRATLIHYALTPEKNSKLFLRKIGQKKITIKDFNLTEDEVNFFIDSVKKHKNILISGGTGSGKTSMMKAMLDNIPSNEHVLVMEDTHEITAQNPAYSNLVSDEMAKKSLKDYCSYALRMRPDRIILGEIRGKEIVPFMLAMNTGHKGLMATLHANNAIDTLHRCALLFCLYNDGQALDYELVLKLICQNIDYVIHLENKQVIEVARIIGAEGNNCYVEQLLTRDSLR